jgi:CRP-like cAMP-binding protein
MQPPGTPAQLFTGLSEGDVFGESCLLREEPRHTDVVVQGHLTALRMPKDSLDALVRKHRRVAEVLLELLTRRLIGNFLNGSHLFADVDPQTRTDIANMFEVRRAAVDTAVMEAGKRSDGVYIALTGRVLCKLPGIDHPIEAGPGSMFGHASLLGESPSEVGIRTMANMILLRLPAARFTRVAMQYPTLLERITELPPLADVSL